MVSMAVDSVASDEMLRAVLFIYVFIVCQERKNSNTCFRHIILRIWNNLNF